MPGRIYASNTYRYGFNGKENDDDAKGITGSQQDYGFRVYDPRLGRFLSVDPLTKCYPELTPYQFASNTPIQAIDLDGLEAWISNTSGSVLYGPYSNSFVDANNLTPTVELNAIYVTSMSAEMANQGFGVPPYTPGTRVIETETPATMQLTRVYTNNVTEPAGRWLMDPKDIQGLTPKQIQDKFSLPNTPTHKVDVEVPQGTTIRIGEANEAFGGNGGGTQYQLMNRIPLENYANPEVLPESPMFCPIAPNAGPLNVFEEAPTTTGAPVFQNPTATETPVFEPPTTTGAPVFEPPIIFEEPIFIP